MTHISKISYVQFLDSTKSLNYNLIMCKYEVEKADKLHTATKMPSFKF